MRRRRGFSLVEMLACISVGSVLLVLSMKVIHRTMRIESRARETAAVQHHATRLARQFRRDVHQAESMQIGRQEPEQNALELTLSGGLPTVYLAEPGHVVRTQQLPDGTTHRDCFSLPDDCSVHLAQLDSPARAVLTIDRDTRLVGVAPRIELHIEAVIGKLSIHHRAEGGP